MDTLAHKYLSITDWLREQISSGTFSPGQKLPSENQLCQQFGVSRQTVRQAIACLEQQNLISRIQGSGTYVNATDTPTTHKNIGILTSYIGEYIFPDLIAGIQNVLAEHNCQMTLKLTHNKVANEKKELLALLDADIDGLIVEATKSALPNPNLYLYKEFANRGIPVVFINTAPQGLRCNSILNNDPLGAQLATEHLIAQGHTHIGAILKQDDLQGHERYQGLVETLYKHDLPLQESAILWYSTEGWEHLFSDAGVKHMMKHLANVSAVMCYNDSVAFEFYKVLKKQGLRIPDDLSVVSFDNSSLAQMARPPLTTVTHPSRDLGARATQTLLDTIRNPHIKIQHVYQPELIVRASTAKVEASP